MEKLNQDSEWPKKSAGDIEIFEKEKDEWPSDYYECLKPVYQLKTKESDEKSRQHWEIFKSTHNLKEFVTVLLIEAREELKAEYGFSELTVLEIKSLVDISKRLSKQLSDEESIENFLKDNKGYDRFNKKYEVVDNWLIENYGIHSRSYGNINNKLFMEEWKKGEGISLGEALDNAREREKQFNDYVRKVRDKALLANKK